jgi:hypothetical protein
MEVLFLTIILLTLIIGSMVFFYRLSKVFSLKGYNSPLYQGLFLLLGFVNSISGIFFTDDPNFEFTSTYFLTVAIPIVGALMAWAIVYAIPEGDKRRFGARETTINWYYLGIFSIILLVIDVILIFTIEEEMYVRHLVKMTTLLTAAATYCFYMNKRSEMPDAETVLAEDKRPPVLFLRAFKNEDFPFVILSQDEANEQGIDDIQNPITFERFMAPFTNQNIGPFIALGSPEDYLPKDGAYRVYATDKNWKNYVKKWTKSATAIYMPIDNSENLGWELAFLKKSKLCHKLLVFTEPAEPDTFANRYSNAVSRLVEGEKKVTWAEFKAVLEKYDYVLPKKEPKGGSTISFDEDGVGVLVKEGSRSAAEYLSSSFTFQ